MLVPVRGVFEGMGGTVSWDDPSKTITVKKGENETLVLKVGMNLLILKGSCSISIIDFWSKPYSLSRNSVIVIFVLEFFH